MSFNFLNLLSEVTSGNCINLEVAAMIASGVLIAYCCLISIAIFLISGFKSMMIQSSNRAVSFLFSKEVSSHQPNNSISEIMEIITELSRKGLVFAFPSCTFIRKLVSATNLSPLISYFFLISCSIQPTFKFAKMFFQRFLLPFFCKLNNGLIYFVPGYRSFNFYNHNSNITKIIQFMILWIGISFAGYKAAVVNPEKSVRTE